MSNGEDSGNNDPVAFDTGADVLVLYPGETCKYCGRDAVGAIGPTSQDVPERFGRAQPLCSDHRDKQQMSNLPDNVEWRPFRS